MVQISNCLRWQFSYCWKFGKLSFGFNFPWAFTPKPSGLLRLGLGGGVVLIGTCGGWNLLKKWKASSTCIFILLPYHGLETWVLRKAFGSSVGMSEEVVQETTPRQLKSCTETPCKIPASCDVNQSCCHLNHGQRGTAPILFGMYTQFSSRLFRKNWLSVIIAYLPFSDLLKRFRRPSWNSTASNEEEI